MATRYAVANGNWSNIATWNGGASLPGAGDNVYTGGKTVTIDQDITVLSLGNNVSSYGGSFLITQARTINANLYHGTYASTNLIVCSHITGTLIINGNINNPVASGVGVAIQNTSSGNVLITGQLLSGGAGEHCILNQGSGTITVFGNITSSPSSSCINSTGSGTINITGNLGSSGYYIIYCSTTCNINITGDITSSTNPAIYTIGAVNLIVNGTITASNASYGISLGSTSVAEIFGDVYSSNNYPAINIPLGQVKLSGNCFGYNGINPICSLKLTITDSTPVVYSIQDFSLNTKPLYSTDNILLGYPAESDTREGTIFGHSSEFEGTLKVPPVNTVLLGVPTDNTVGTLVPGGATAADIWDYLLTSIVTPNSIGELIKTNLDAKVSSITGTTPAQIWNHLLTSILTPESIGLLIKNYIKNQTKKPFILPVNDQKR